MPRALTLISLQKFAKSVNSSDNRSQITSISSFVILLRIISEFRVCFTTVVMKHIKTTHTLKKALHTYLHMVLAIFEGFVCIVKNLQYNFPRGERGRGKGRLKRSRKFIRFGAVSHTLDIVAYILPSIKIYQTAYKNIDNEFVAWRAGE